MSRRRRGRGVLALAAAAVAAGCGVPREDVGSVTRSSLDSLEAGRQRLAAGDHRAARDAFAAAADGGGLQPDFYCEARLQQANCASLLGDHAEALAVLDDLARGAADMDRVTRLMQAVRARQAEAADAAKPAGR